MTANPTPPSSRIGLWLCRRGWHSWRFVSMSDVRRIDIIGHSATLCRLVERCPRCGLTRTQQGARVPTRPKVDR